jgi:hypothetical protein
MNQGSMRHAAYVGVFAVALQMACSTADGDADGSNNPNDETNPDGDVATQAAAPVFTCDASAKPDELALPRLSRGELERTLRFAIKLAVPADADAIWTSVSSTFARYPSDLKTPAPGDLRGGYARSDQAIQQTRIDAMYDVSVAIAQALTSTPARRGTMMGACATDASAANDRTCLEGFIGKWGARVTRTPLSPEDVTFYADIAGATPVSAVGVAEVLTAILNSPQLLYRVEHGTDNAQPTAPLSAFELASRLSYQFWQSPPDDELWGLAQSGKLLEADTYTQQVARIVRAPETRNALGEFVSQWLRLEELPPLDALKDDATFKAFAGAQMPASTSRDAMIDDVLSAAFVAVNSGGSVSDFLNDRHSYAKDPFVAGIYQVPVWDGAGPAPLFASEKRAGLLTRAAMLSTGTATTRPIHKGYLVRNALLCQQVGTPPPNVNTMPPTATESQTTRQAVTALTSGGACAGCHETRINPPGFITENFDALGRERTEEKLFDAQGAVVASLPVDTSAVPAVRPNDTRAMTSAGELVQAIDTSRLFHSCLARHYFRFTERRVESVTNDGCLLANIEKAARSEMPMADVLKSIVQDPQFKARRFQ